MESKNCQFFVGQIQMQGGSSNNLRMCSKRAEYYCPDIEEYLCTIHLKKVRAFSKNPICLENDRSIDRHTLYLDGKIEYLKGYKNCDGRKIKRCIDCDLIAEKTGRNNWCIYSGEDLENICVIPEWCPLDEYKKEV